MRNYIIWIFAIVIISVLSCNPPIVFTTAQPEGVAMSDTFDPIYQGSFYCESDNSMVFINEKTVYKKHWFDFVISKDKVQSDDRLEENQGFLFVKDFGQFPINDIKNDSIYASMWLMDTLFSIDGEEQVLKSYQGYQILNLKLKDNKYEVVILSLDENLGIELQYTSLPEDLTRLEKITTVLDISTDEITQYMINPTAMEFDQILRQKIVFETCDYFQRVEVLNFLDHLD